MFTLRQRPLHPRLAPNNNHDAEHAGRNVNSGIPREKRHFTDPVPKNRSYPKIRLKRPGVNRRWSFRSILTLESACLKTSTNLARHALEMSSERSAAIGALTLRKTSTVGFTRGEIAVSMLVDERKDTACGEMAKSACLLRQLFRGYNRRKSLFDRASSACIQGKQHDQAIDD